MANLPLPVTWLWGTSAVRLTGALQALRAQQLYFLAEQPPPMTAPDVVILSSEPAPADQVGQLDLQHLIQDFEQNTLIITDWLQRAVRLMHKRKGAHKGTIILLAIEATDQSPACQITTLTRQAGLSNLMQSLAREWGKRGIHVAYLPIPASTPSTDVAALCWHLHQQPISSWSYQPQLLLRAHG
ncbi:MAG: hypothetical protein RLY58_2295 [Pseudomonadota bacterium]|jgi:NAD(P)-dependent dehydrogenase (short-subunit alcohol dehydrogenase family)